MLRVLLVLVPLALTIYAFIDCLNTKEDEVKHLPKVVWVIIILLAWVVGPIGWIVAGREKTGGPYGLTKPESRRWVAPDDNPEFLNSLKPQGDRPGDPDQAPDGDQGSDHGNDRGNDHRGGSDTPGGASGKGGAEGGSGSEAEDGHTRGRRSEEDARSDEGESGPGDKRG